MHNETSDFNKCPSGHKAPMNPQYADLAQNEPELSNERQTSSIPSQSGKPWIYPSEQMFYAAMLRKNKNPEKQDMQTIIPIHNTVNEQCWKMIKEYEQLDNTCTTKLVKFQGKQGELTIKARLYSFFGYQLPFDRHDWVIDRCGKQVTYIIDFYKGHGGGLSFYLDVRPAMTMSGIYERLRFQIKHWFS